MVCVDGVDECIELFLCWREVYGGLVIDDGNSLLGGFVYGDKEEQWCWILVIWCFVNKCNGCVFRL